MLPSSRRVVDAKGGGRSSHAVARPRASVASRSGAPLKDLLKEDIVQALLALLALALLACILAYAWARRERREGSPARTRKRGQIWKRGGA